MGSYGHTGTSLIRNRIGQRTFDPFWALNPFSALRSVCIARWCRSFSLRGENTGQVMSLLHTMGHEPHLQTRGCQASQGPLPLYSEKKSYSLTTYWSNHRDGFSGPALRHGSLNPLFQVALYQSCYQPAHTPDVKGVWGLMIHSPYGRQGRMGVGGFLRKGQLTFVALVQHRL